MELHQDPDSLFDRFFDKGNILIKDLKAFLNGSHAAGGLINLPNHYANDAESWFINIPIPTTPQQLSYINSLIHYPQAISSRGPLGSLKEVINHIVYEEYKELGTLTVSTRKLLEVFLYNNRPFPIIHDIVVGDNTLTVSIPTEESLTMDDEKWGELYSAYVSVKDSDPNPTPEEMSRSDVLFDEVNEAMQEAINHSKEPVLQEAINSGTTDRGTYVVEVRREFANREDYLAYMTKVIAL